MTYIIQNPEAPATNKQTWAIKCLGGGDVRDAGLTRLQASDLIGELKAAKGQTSGKAASLATCAPDKATGPKRSYKAIINVGTGEKKVTRTQSYNDLLDKAVTAGLEAGRAALPTPMVVTQHANPLDDSSPAEQSWYVGEGACGFADVNFSMKSGLGRKFGQWLIKNDYARKDSYRGGVTIWISDHGQSVERKSAHASAMAKVLQEAGIADAYSSSRMD